ncbi:MAG TPA: hypothetical protein VFZ21_32455 [Gemmatimonadaceae bacterium]|nr:hypothetical protein [Gemmatimonadaceae bacterium]
MVGRMVRGGIGAALALAAQACSDASGLDPVELYRMEQFEGVRLPALVFQGDGVSSTIVGAEALLLRGGQGRMTTTLRNVDPATPEGRIESHAFRFTYVVGGTRIEITYECPPNADCMPGPHLTGERLPDRLALAPPTSSRLASIYRRVD